MKRPMPKWAGTLTGKMNCAGVSSTELANELGVTKQHVWMMLHGDRRTSDAKVILTDAFDSIMKRRKENADQKTSK